MHSDSIKVKLSLQLKQLFYSLPKQLAHVFKIVNNNNNNLLHSKAHNSMLFN